jgi:hypothetical protein
MVGFTDAERTAWERNALRMYSHVLIELGSRSRVSFDSEKGV